MHSCAQFTVDGTTYNCLRTLSLEYPVDSDAERRQAEQETQAQKDAELKAIREKREAEKKQKAEDQLRLQAEAEYNKLLKTLEANPNHLFRPVFISYCKELPTVCPYDGKELRNVHVYKKGLSKDTGLCCLYCSRLFLLEENVTIPQKRSKRDNHNTPISATSKKKTERKMGVSPKVVVLPQHIEAIPSSTILVVELFQDYKDTIGSLAIVSDVSDQQSTAGLYWVGRSLPSTVLAAIATDSLKRFVYKGYRFKANVVAEYPGINKYLDIISRFSNPQKPQTVYVFAQKNIDSFNTSDFEMVTAMVPCKKSTFPVPIPVYYQRSSQTYFINEVTYTDARVKYGLPYLRLRIATLEEASGVFGNLKQHSELNLLGYSVGANSGMDAPNRQALLAEIIDSGVLSKPEIINHLEWLIQTRSSNLYMDNAVSEWSSDLKFVYRYKADNQRTIWVSAFYSKYSGRNELR
jgi:hypothetical protein